MHAKKKILQTVRNNPESLYNNWNTLASTKIKPTVIPLVTVNMDSLNPEQRKVYKQFYNAAFKAEENVTHSDIDHLKRLPKLYLLSNTDKKIVTQYLDERIKYLAEIQMQRKQWKNSKVWREERGKATLPSWPVNLRKNANRKLQAPKILHTRYHFKPKGSKTTQPTPIQIAKAVQTHRLYGIKQGAKIVNIDKVHIEDIDKYMNIIGRRLRNKTGTVTAADTKRWIEYMQHGAIHQPKEWEWKLFNTLTATK